MTRLLILAVAVTLLHIDLCGALTEPIRPALVCGDVTLPRVWQRTEWH